MQYKRFGDTCFVRIDLNEEIMQCLKAVCEKEDIHLAQVDAIGAINHGIVGVFNLQEQAYHREELNGFMEITSLTSAPPVKCLSGFFPERFRVCGTRISALT